MPKCAFVLLPLISFFGCQQSTISDETETSTYHDIDLNAARAFEMLVAVSKEEFLGYGSEVAYVNLDGDTIINFGQFNYFGTDTLRHYANVIPYSDRKELGPPIAIDGHGNQLFDLFLFDNGPDYFSEGLTRVKRNGKIGFGNERGEIIVPCQYAFAHPFENGLSKVTYEATKIREGEHTRIVSDDWFWIDRTGKKQEFE